jgi:single-strand DNA-binding protein
MASLNKIMLIGNLGKDPVVRTFENTGNKVANFSLAVSSKDRDGNEKTEWFDIAVWGRQAEIAEKWLKKGKNIFVEGRLQSRMYKDNNGLDKKVYEVVADNFVMLGGNDRNAEGGQQSGGYTQSGGASLAPEKPTYAANQAVQEEDDLPF